MSLICVLADGASAEISAFGDEGIPGIALFMGGANTPRLAVVQRAGDGFRLPAQVLKREVDRAGPMLQLLLRCAHALVAQTAQTRACNRYHTVEQQLCRWLLLSRDRLSTDSLNMTQELIAKVLGVRREGGTEAAGQLQDAGLVRYRHGHVEVLDRRGLKWVVCEHPRSVTRPMPIHSRSAPSQIHGTPEIPFLHLQLDSVAACTQSHTAQLHGRAVG